MQTEFQKFTYWWTFFVLIQEQFIQQIKLIKK